jgi:hypothetical protein
MGYQKQSREANERAIQAEQAGWSTGSLLAFMAISAAVGLTVGGMLKIK